MQIQDRQSQKGKFRATADPMVWLAQEPGPQVGKK
jgi:hypothetical protein